MKIAANFLRMGTESAFVVLAKAKKLEAEGKEIINLGIITFGINVILII